MRRACLFALLASAACASLRSPPADAAGLARPDPVLVSVHLDYVAPLQAPGGETAQLVPLDPSVSAQAVADETYLHYRTPGDLGGFAIAPVGASAFFSGGEDIVGAGNEISQIPQYGEAAQGVVRSFAFLGSGGSAVPDNGRAKLPGLGVPPLLEAPINSNAVPPPNRGFGGSQVPEAPERPATNRRPSQEGPSAERPSREKRPVRKAPTSTSTSPAPTTPPATSPSSTAPTGTTPPGSGEEAPRESGASCGTAGLRITSDHSTCRIYAVNMEPGQSASEVMTVRDEAGVPVSLSLRASGEESRFWNDLRMGVWPVGTPAPDPLPALVWWTTQENSLTTLQPDQAVPYEIELFLPASAGNEDQGQAAVIDLTWTARQ